MAIRGFQALYTYIYNCVTLYLLVKQNPVIPNIDNGANITIYILRVNNCIYIIILVDTFVNIKM